jgi:hypothetical protein
VQRNSTEATGERDVLIVGRGIEHREDLRLDGIDERIDQALTLDEAAALRKQFAALAPRERASWVATLVLLPVADAVAAIRA